MTTFENNERFIRWQWILRDQLTFSNNLLFTISVVILGWFINFLQNQEVQNFSRYEKLALTIGLSLIVMSLMLWLSLICNRLHDFRNTLKKVRHDSDVSSEKLRGYWKITWGLFNLQIVTLMLGIFSFIWFVYLNYILPWY